MAPAFLVGAVILLVTMGVAYSGYEVIGRSLTTIPIPRMSNFSILPGSVDLWRLLANKFGMDFQFWVRALPVGFGFLAGALFLGIAYGLTRWVGKDSPLSSLVYSMIFITVVAGVLLSPTLLLGGMDTQNACSQDVIAAYEKVGAELSARIPPGSQVYWEGDPSPIPLLYARQIKIYPPQLNQVYSFVVSADTDKALRYGYWNEELAQKWFSEADILLIKDADYMSMKSRISPAVFNELERTSPTFPCDPGTSIRIFKRQ